MIIEFCDDWTTHAARSCERWETGRDPATDVRNFFSSFVSFDAIHFLFLTLSFWKSSFFATVTFLRRKLDVFILLLTIALRYEFPRLSFTTSLIKHWCRPGRGQARAHNERRVSRISIRIRTIHDISTSRITFKPQDSLFHMN